MADDVGSGLTLAAEADAKKPGWFMGLSRTRKFVLAGAAALVLIAAAGAYAHWTLIGSHIETTDNAYVKADISVVSAQVEGYVRALPAAENQAVHAGDVLAEIDAADYRAAVANARAELASAQADIASNSANRQAAAAQLARYQYLAQRGLLSNAGLDSARAQAGQWRGSTAAAQADAAAAQARLEAAEIALERTIIRAPIDGVVGNRVVQAGQLVRPGAALMSIVPHTLYVEANFKETQLAHLAPGQRVELRPDVDRSMRLSGVVESLSPASGSEFSFIPTETATGNFTKIVQRVPVRIRIDETPEARRVLRPGLSVTATVDTRTPANSAHAAAGPQTAHQ
ncbi:MAG: efflux RND transporter periplasmic adaptor subunit [Hyphomonadaceae bacterium]